jgi:dsRNA-specific ribonuclease
MVTNGHGTTRRNAEQSAAEEMLVVLKSGEL